MSTLPIVYTIDDDVALNILMKARFEKYLCSVETFTDSKKLYEAIKKQAPNLVLVDLNLGEGVSGFDVIANLRENLSLTCPILVLSGDSQNSQVAHALEIGATDYLVKSPFKPEFEARLARYIQSVHFPEVMPTTFVPLKGGHQLVKVEFNLQIEEVHPMGFTLLSTNLIRKGYSFWLQGEILKKMKFSNERILVTVIGSASTFSENRKLYQLKVEVDSGNEDVIHDIRSFLGRMRVSTE